MMIDIDHAPYFREQARAEQENAEMAELEQRSAPLQYALIVAVIAIALAGIVEQSSDFIQRYTDLAASNEAMVQCLNGRLINIDGVLVGCKAHNVALVEVQP